MKTDLGTLANLKEQRKDIDKQILDFKKVITSNHCAIKIGDEILCNGYSHKGKTMGVDNIVMRDMWGGSYEFLCTGPIKKKDGTFGIVKGEHRIAINPK